MDELLSQSSGSQRAALSLLPPWKCGTLYRYVFLRLSQNGFKLVCSSSLCLPINLNFKKSMYIFIYRCVPLCLATQRFSTGTVTKGQQYVNVQNLPVYNYPYMTEQEWSLGSTRLGVEPLIQETCLTSSKPSNPRVLTSQLSQ